MCKADSSETPNPKWNAFNKYVTSQARKLFQRRLKDCKYKMDNDSKETVSQTW